MHASLAPTRDGAEANGDGRLVARVRRGDDRAFEALYDRYQGRIAAYVYGMVRDHGRAEDIVQEVFLSAHRRMRANDRPIAFKPWVYEIAKNACIDQFRRSRRAEEVSFDPSDGEPGPDLGSALTSRTTPDAVHEGKEALGHLCGAFGGLSETHHQILVMRELEGLSYQEIGNRLGLTRPAVESTLFRARRRLWEEYGELASGERCRRVQGIIGAAHLVSPGVRDRRRVAVHVAHCQPCRRHAHEAGLALGAITSGRLTRTRVAALLPLPVFLRRRGSVDGPSAVPSHAGTFAQWSAQAGTYLDPSAAGWLRAATTAATVAIFGVGASHVGSVVGHDAGRSHRDASDAVVRAAPAPAAAKIRIVRRTATVATPGAASARQPGRAAATGATGAKAHHGGAATTPASGIVAAAAGTAGHVTGVAGTEAVTVPPVPLKRRPVGVAQLLETVGSAVHRAPAGGGAAGAVGAVTAPATGAAQVGDEVVTRVTGIVGAP